MRKKSSGSSQRVKRPAKKRSITTVTASEKRQLKNLNENEIDLSDPDIPEILDWSGAEVGKFYRPVKKQITIRLDADILDWFQRQPCKYQTLINRVCREYMSAHKNNESMPIKIRY